MQNEQRCPACGNGKGLARRVTTVLGRKNTVVLDMTCESCSHEWRTEHTSATRSPFESHNPKRLNAATGPLVR
jgi:YgiT-type zinc finger domain-containing protein